MAKKGRRYKEASTGIVSCAALSGWGTNAVLASLTRAQACSVVRNLNGSVLKEGQGKRIKGLMVE